MNKIKEISVFVIFGLIFFTVHSITKKNESHPNESIISLPKSTTKYTRIESVQILKKFIFNELFIVKEKAIFEKIKKIIEYGFTEEGFEKLEDSLEMIISMCKNDKLCFYPQVWQFFIPLIDSVVGTELEIQELHAKGADKIFIGNGYEELQSVTNAITLFIVR